MFKNKDLKEWLVDELIDGAKYDAGVSLYHDAVKVSFQESKHADLILKIKIKGVPDITRTAWKWVKTAMDHALNGVSTLEYIPEKPGMSFGLIEIYKVKIKIDGIKTMRELITVLRIMGKAS